MAQLFIQDFSILCYSDILINSSSTFCLAAVFIGKSDKKVIHSKVWMDRVIRGDFSNKEYLSYRKVGKDNSTDDNWITTGGYSKAKYFFIDLLNIEKNQYFNVLSLV